MNKVDEAAFIRLAKSVLPLRLAETHPPFHVDAF